MKRLFVFLLILASISACSVSKADNFTNIAATPTPAVRTEKPKDLNVTKQNNSGILIIKPSNFIGTLRKKKNANPKMTAKQLADFGNDLIATSGYDYTFDWEPKGKENEESLAKADFKDYFPFYYQFTDAMGKSEKYELMNRGFGHPCFSVIDVPVTKITDETMTVISDGKQVALKRPKDFNLEEFVLVDASLKKVIRKWKTPIDALPEGISEDGKKVYFSSWEFEQDMANGYKIDKIGLAVELSEDGTLKLVDLGAIKSDKGTQIDYDKEFTEIIYNKYKVGNKEYILKFPAPCT